MSWPSNITKAHLDQSTDDPSQARAELAAAVDAINDIIDSLAVASGVCELDGSGKIPVARMDNMWPTGTEIIFTHSGALPTGWSLKSLANTYGLVIDHTNYGTTAGSHDPKLMDKIPSHQHGATGLSASTTDTATWEIIYGTGGGSPRGALGAGFGAYAGPIYQTTISGSVAANAGASNWTPRILMGRVGVHS